MWKESESHSVMCDSLWHHELYSSRNSPGQNTGVDSLSLLQGSNPGLPHCRWILYQLSHKGSPAGVSESITLFLDPLTTVHLLMSLHKTQFRFHRITVQVKLPETSHCVWNQGSHQPTFLPWLPEFLSRELSTPNLRVLFCFWSLTWSSSVPVSVPVFGVLAPSSLWLQRPRVSA